MNRGAMLLRGLVVAGVLLSADVHLELWGEDYRYLHIIGPLFLVNAISGLVIALAVLAWRHWVPLFLAAGFGATTLVFFYITVTVGLFGYTEIASGTQQQLAQVGEYVAIVAAAAAWYIEDGRRLLRARRERGAIGRHTRNADENVRLGRGAPPFARGQRQR